MCIRDSHTSECDACDDGGPDDDDEGGERDDGHDDLILQHIDEGLVLEVVGVVRKSDDSLASS